MLEELKSTLTAYLDAVPRQQEPNPPPLLPLMLRLEELQKQLPADAPERIRHYMHSKSYRKAFEYLNGLPSSPGSCGR
jgi:hypothetical protein